MKLITQIVEFLSQAKGEIATPKEGILLSPKHKSIIAADGYRLHAVRNSQNTVACIADFKGGIPFVVGNHEEYPSLEKTLNDDMFDVTAKIFINPEFLLDAIKHSDGMIRLEILKRKKADRNLETNDTVQIFSYVGGVPAYALIMGMTQTKEDQESGELGWKPRLEEVNA